MNRTQLDDYFNTSAATTIDDLYWSGIIHIGDKAKEVPSKWLQKVIKNRGLK